MAKTNVISVQLDMKANIVLFLVFLLSGSVLAGDVVVGTVTHLSGTFSVKRIDGSAKMLSVKSEVKEGDLLTTESDTYARIKFVDGGELVLRPNSQLRVDKYAFNDTDASKDNVLIGLLRGGLRAVTGLIGKRSRDRVGYVTTVATIGIRGTNHGMLLCSNNCGDIPTATGQTPPNGLHVDVAQGAVIVTNPAGSQSFTAGQFGFVASALSPPILVPAGQGIQVTMPPSISVNAAHGRSPGGAGRDTSCVF